jgi:uncharacterized protein (TIGR02996 family)
MTDGLALVRSILAATGDDAPRLVYADWLEEHGQPERAEFIRVQCELARLMILDDSEPSENADRRWESLVERERVLWHDSRQIWLAEETRIASFPIELHWFDRGMMTLFDCPFYEWAECGNWLIERHPLEIVTIRQMPQHQRRYHGPGGREHRPDFWPNHFMIGIPHCLLEFREDELNEAAKSSGSIEQAFLQRAWPGPRYSINPDGGWGP